MRDGMISQSALLPAEKISGGICDSQLETNESIPPHVFHFHPFGMPNVSLKPGLIA